MIVILLCSWFTLVSEIAISDSNITFLQIEPFLNTKGLPVPSPKNNSNDVVITAAGNEYEPARVLVSTSKDWGITTASISELKNETGIILPKDSIELRYALRWKQLVAHAYKTKDGPTNHVVDELLVFDSTETLSGTWEGGQYNPPTPSTNFRIDVTKNAIQQLWITVHIGVNQPAGSYTGTLTLQSSNQNASIPLSVNVLPFNLPEPDKHFGLFYRGSLDDNKRNISIEALAAQFQDIRNHGFTTLVINDHNPPVLAEVAKHFIATGFPGPLVLGFPANAQKDTTKTDAAVKVIQDQGIPYFLAGIDEPNTPERISEQIKHSNDAPANTRIFTSLLTSTDDTLIQKGVTLDWANFNVKSGLADLKKKSGNQGRIATYYWQSYLEDAPRNRYYTGAFLLKTGLDGVLPYTYQAFHSIDPYTTDTRELGGSAFRKTRLYKSFTTTYPTTGTPIPTIQWEAAREGIDDYRYSMVFRQLAAKQSNRNKTRLTKQLNKKLEEISYLESRPFKIDANFNASSLTEFRHWLIDEIAQIQQQ